jgi:hypothetical protein
MGIEPTIPVFERAKTVHALDRTATVTGSRGICFVLIKILARYSLERPEKSHDGPQQEQATSLLILETNTSEIRSVS